MSEKPKLKYEKPVSIDMGRVAPVLGSRCSNGPGAEDCSNGTNNTSVPACNPVGPSADVECYEGSNAGRWCYPGTTAGVGCHPGSGVGS